MDHRSGGRVRKMTVWRARVERHPLDEYHAVPGHVLRLEGGGKWGIVCGDNKLLILEEIEIDGEAVTPAAFFKTVRQRMGLDHSLLAVEAARRLDALESLGATAARFVERHGGELDAMEAEIAAIIDAALSRLDGTVPAEANPLRNYSFQKRWFDWERRERWFGVQIYRSLRLTEVEGEPYALGFWRFSNERGEVEHRIYLALKPDRAAELGARAEAMFSAAITEPAHIALNDNGDVEGLYAAASFAPEIAAERIAALAEALWQGETSGSGS
jgi:hypothetical protein